MMSQPSNTMNLLIQDSNGQPQVIKVVQSGGKPIGSIITTQPLKILKSVAPNQEAVQTGSPAIRTLATSQKVITKALPAGTLARLSQKGPDGHFIQRTVRLNPSNNFTIINKSTNQKVQIQTSATTIPVVPQQNQTTPSNNQTTSTKLYISPPILDHTGARKRQEAVDADYTPEYKRRKTEKAGKGLRHFSMKVCEKVRKKGTTSYNEVADELVEEFTDSMNSTLADQQYDQKNIRRRVYDALNVLMAMNIISKERKEIRWLGLPTSSLQECIQLEREKKQRIDSIREKTQKLYDLILNQIAFKNLALRNKRREQEHGAPAPNSYIQLPFIVVNTNKKTVIDCSISNDKMEYFFHFNDKFEIHDDVFVLKQIGMLMGLDKGECSPENLKKIKELVPRTFEEYVVQLADGAVIDPIKEILESAGPGPSSTNHINADDFVETQLDEDNSRQSSSYDPLSPNQEFSDEEIDSDTSSELDNN